MDWIILAVIIIFIIVMILLVALKWLDKADSDKLPYILIGSLLTNRELEFYKKLKPIADELQLVVCPKVRLSDIVQVHNAGKERQKYLNKIQQKHIDFVLCDNDMKFKLMIELDDRSHQRADRQRSDNFKNELSETVKLPLLRVRSLDEDIKSEITAALAPPPEGL